MAEEPKKGSMSPDEIKRMVQERAGKSGVATGRRELLSNWYDPTVLRNTAVLYLDDDPTHLANYQAGIGTPLSQIGVRFIPAQARASEDPFTTIGTLLAENSLNVMLLLLDHDLGLGSVNSGASLAERLSSVRDSMNNPGKYWEIDMLTGVDTLLTQASEIRGGAVSNVLSKAMPKDQLTHYIVGKLFEIYQLRKVMAELKGEATLELALPETGIEGIANSLTSYVRKSMPVIEGRDKVIRRVPLDRRLNVKTKEYSGQVVPEFNPDDTRNWAYLKMAKGLSMLVKAFEVVTTATAGYTLTFSPVPEENGLKLILEVTTSHSGLLGPIFAHMNRVEFPVYQQAVGYLNAQLRHPKKPMENSRADIMGDKIVVTANYAAVFR